MKNKEIIGKKIEQTHSGKAIENAISFEIGEKSLKGTLMPGKAGAGKEISYDEKGNRYINGKLE